MVLCVMAMPWQIKNHQKLIMAKQFLCLISPAIYIYWKSDDGLTKDFLHFVGLQMADKVPPYFITGLQNFHIV